MHAALPLRRMRREPLAARGERAKISILMWRPVDEPWQYRVLDQLPSGVDLGQLERAAKLTPAERIEAAIELMAIAEELRRARERAEGSR